MHSLRAGGATGAANAGVPDWLFKRHGMPLYTAGALLRSLQDWGSNNSSSSWHTGISSSLTLLAGG